MVRSLPKAPWVLQTLLLIFSWCSHHFSSSPLSPFLPSFPFQSPSTFALVMFLQRVCLQRAWVIHHRTWVNGFWLPFWGHNGQRLTKSADLTGHQKRCVQWVWVKKEGQIQKESQTDTNSECTALESTWSKRTAVLNIFLCYVQSFSAFCMIWRPHLSIIFPSWRMPWQWYEVNWKVI